MDFDDWSDELEESELPSDTPEEEIRRHTFLQEEARMLSSLYKAQEVGNHWRLEALCRDAVYPELDAWFAPSGTQEAKKVTETCFQCPVREKCLEWACLSKQRHGIWGGLGPELRVQKGSRPDKITPHDYPELVKLDNPYITDDPRSKYHEEKLTAWDGDEDDE